MAYWLRITDEKNWKVIKKKNVWGVPSRHKNIIFKVKSGDKLLIYIKRERSERGVIPSRIVAIYEVVSEPFSEYTRIFKAPKDIKGELYPWRIKIKPINIFKKPLEFKSLTPKLKFITNKRKWYVHLMGRSMREIPEHDFDLILLESQRFLGGENNE